MVRPLSSMMGMMSDRSAVSGQRSASALARSWSGRAGAQWIFGPIVLGVATHELTAQVRVVALPKPRQVAGDLNVSIVGGAEMEHEGVVAEPRALF